MRASSTAALGAALVSLNQELGGRVEAEVGTQLAEEFFSLAALSEDSARLSRCLTDPARCAADKQALVQNIFAQQVHPYTLTALQALAAGRWSNEADLAQACHLIATHLLMRVAQGQDQLEAVEREVFAVGELLRKHRELRGALADNTGGNVESRVRLITGLVADQVGPVALRLIQDAVRTAKAGRLQSALRGICDAAAAMRSQAMATVITAVALRPEQVERLRAVLSRRQGQDVAINTVVDPTVVGGIKIRYADSVVDGSVSNLLKETRRRLAS